MTSILDFFHFAPYDWLGVIWFVGVLIYIGCREIDSCFIKDIVQVNKGRVPTSTYPDWVKNYLQDDFNIEEDPFISIWFNYYD